MSNLSSKQVLDIEYSAEDLDALTEERLRAFRKKLYPYEGRFYCCEFRCELQLNDAETIAQYDMWEKNMENVNKALWRKTKDA